MDGFLAGVEGRALRMAEIATGSRDEALDIVQDAMLGLVQRYARRDRGEWGPLFQRILQSRIMDWHRRTGIRNRARVWLGRSPEDDPASDPPGDPIEALPDPRATGPEQALRERGAIGALEDALHELPPRQQQAFLLRTWEGLDVKDTARVMDCSAGSVKTHYSRAVKALRERLGEHWP